MNDYERVPDYVAVFDQALRASVDLAKMIHGYFKALVEEGFSDEQAMELTISYQESLMTSITVLPE